ncbi:phage terminase small subunit [Gracilibacillus sp. D59]|uniref:phage terminase small subunit n=1 Tax=Gracilibacillus sp. D59 TaxID=3457434 RepID=UPI003FCD1696
MARPRNPKRDEAFEIWKSSNGEKKLKDIAAELEVSDSQIRKWKNQDKWNEKLNGNVTKLKGNVTKRKRGAPKGSKNAIGNRGGAAPKGNANAVSHGFFRTIFPEDEETLEIVDAIQKKSPVDMLWENIVIKYTAIARAQKLMYVKDQDDITKVLKKQKDISNDNMDSVEKEWEFQFAWDKHATFMQAQARAMSELRGLIKDFLLLSGQDDYRRKQLEKMQHDMDVAHEKFELEKGKANNDNDQSKVIDEWIEAMGDLDGQD